MKRIVIVVIFLLQGCSLWSNDDMAKLEKLIEFNGFYFAFYTQQMWDGEIQFLIRFESYPPNKIESPLGVPEISEGSVLVKDFKHSGSISKAALEVQDGVVVFCGASSCEYIASAGSVLRPFVSPRDAQSMHILCGVVRPQFRTKCAYDGRSCCER